MPFIIYSFEEVKTLKFSSMKQFIEVIGEEGIVLINLDQIAAVLEKKEGVLVSTSYSEARSSLDLIFRCG